MKPALGFRLISLRSCGSPKVDRLGLECGEITCGYLHLDTLDTRKFLAGDGNRMSSGLQWAPGNRTTGGQVTGCAER